MIPTLILSSSQGSEICLNLSYEQRIYSFEDILKSQNQVYEDVFYRLSLRNAGNIAKVDLFVNGESVACSYHEGVIIPATDQGLFSGLIGFSQISLCATNDEGNVYWLYSEYVSILVKSTRTNQVISDMLRYIYDNQGDFLFKSTTQLENSNDINNRRYDDYFSQLLLIERIAYIYENSYGFFKANSRYKLESVSVVDRIEKLQNVSANTIQYMVQHPEYLKKSVAGIGYGRQVFMPVKTLMYQNRMTKDIYENQVIVSFLDVVLKKTEEIISEIDNFLELVSIEETTENGYIISSHILYVDAVTSLKGIIFRYQEVEKKLQSLNMMYKKALDATLIDCSRQPEPTAIFLSIPQYHQIFVHIIQWFSKTGYEFVKEKALMSYFEASKIYEIYVLVKLIRTMESLGLEMISASHVDYYKSQFWKYNHQECNNTFIFQSGEDLITLYYEPVIYSDIKRSSNHINLYRNNTVSLNHDNEFERSGQYYVPDYLIKLERDGDERYIICDAKFSRQSQVRYQYTPDLIYKYLFSISGISTISSIKGLAVFYGKTDQNVETEKFYDCAINEISPFVDLIPVAYYINDSDIQKNVLRLLQRLMGKG